MTVDCADVQPALSAIADGEPVEGLEGAAIDAHLEGCAACRSFQRSIVTTRQLLRFEPAAGRDFRPAVRATLDARAARRSRPGWAAVAAAAAIGAVAGASFVGFDRATDEVAAADLPRLVLSAQHHLDSLTADVALVDAAGHDYRGVLWYQAPESMSIDLRDHAGTRLATVVDDGRWWAEGPRRCIGSLGGGCGAPTVQAIERREPFAPGTVALDVIAPVEALAIAPATTLGERDVDGRRAVGVAVTASQVDALVRSIDPLGAIPPVHAADHGELWLDAIHMVPLELELRAGNDPGRVRWAAARGMPNEPGAVVLRITLSDVDINGEVTRGGLPDPPAGTVPRDGGFVPGPADDAPVPATLPRGMQPHLSGTTDAGGPAVAVRSWSDGRAWLTVRATRAWPGGHLFGDLGPFVRVVDLGGAGIAYSDERGDRIALHTQELDVVVSGSLAPAQIRAVAASLGIHGQRVPPSWSEAATATIEDAARTAPGLLAPLDVDGFELSAVRIDGPTVTMAVQGSGDRGALLVRTATAQLSPPLDPDVVGIHVRGTEGRYRPATGDLEWLESGALYTLRSTTLDLSQLISIAAELEQVP